MYPSLENSTNGIAIMETIYTAKFFWNFFVFHFIFKLKWRKIVAENECCSGPRQQIEPHSNSWQYLFINYLGNTVVRNLTQPLTKLIPVAGNTYPWDQYIFENCILIGSWFKKKLIWIIVKIRQEVMKVWIVILSKQNRQCVVA